MRLFFKFALTSDGPCIYTMRRSILLTTLLVCLTTLASAASIRLKNGTVIEGEITNDDGTTVTIQADLIGEIKVARSDIDSHRKDTDSAADPAATTSAVARVTAPSPVQVARSETEKDPNKPYVKRSISFNGNYSTPNFSQGPLGSTPVPPGLPGTGAQLGLQGVTYNYGVSGLYLRATKSSVLEMKGNFNQAEYEPAGKVVDAYGAEINVLKMRPNPDHYFFGSAAYKVDKIALIDYEFETIGGYGFKMLETDKALLHFGPGVGVSQAKQGTIYDEDWIVSVGFFERFEYKFNEQVSLEQRLKGRLGVEETDVWKLDAEVKLKAALTKQVAFTITGNYSDDNTLGPIPGTILEGLGPLGPIYSVFSPAKKGRLSIQSGIEFDF